MRTTDEIYGEMLELFRRETGLEPGNGGDMAVRLYAVAAQIYALYVQGEWVGRQCFPQTAQGEYLDRHAQLRGLERREAVHARGAIRFETESPAGADLQIPAGTVCMTAGLVRVETEESGVLAAGQSGVTLRAAAVEPGDGGNVAAGAVRAMAVAPAGVSRCTNPEAFSGGADSEGDGALRERVLETFRRMPNGANAAFYQQGALSFPEVAAATVVPRGRGVGTVDVIVATAAGVPDGRLLERLRAWFEARREIAVDVEVLAPTPKEISVAVAVSVRPGRSFSAVAAEVERRIRQWFDGGRLGQDVLLAQLGQLIFSVDGVHNYRLSAPAADVAVAVTELPRLGALTVSGLEEG